MADAPRGLKLLKRESCSGYWAAQGLQAAAAQGLHGLQAAAAQGLHGLQIFTAQGLHWAICTSVSAAFAVAVGSATAVVARVATLRATRVSLSIKSSRI